MISTKHNQTVSVSCWPLLGVALEVSVGSVDHLNNSQVMLQPANVSKQLAWQHSFWEHVGQRWQPEPQARPQHGTCIYCQSFWDTGSPKTFKKESCKKRLPRLSQEGNRMKLARRHFQNASAASSGRARGCNLGGEAKKTLQTRTKVTMK